MAQENEPNNSIGMGEDISHITLCHRVEKTDENEHSFETVEKIPTDKPVLIFFGGNATTEDKPANGNMAAMERFLELLGFPKRSVDIYAIQYHFNLFDRGGYARRKLFTDRLVPFISKYQYTFTQDEVIRCDPQTHQILHHDAITPDVVEPNYVKELFDKVFLNRICNSRGKKLPVDEAKKRLRNLTICAHCHGAYTFLKVEEMMQAKMAEVGFSEEDRADIQKQLLCLACAPDTPLGGSKSTMISFVSKSDSGLSINNFFSKFMRSQSPLFTAYFPEERGEVFVADHLFQVLLPKEEEHNFLYIEKEEEYKKQLSADGQIFLGFLSNAIVNSLNNAREGGPIPSVEELVCESPLTQSNEFKDLYLAQEFKKLYLAEQFSTFRDYGNLYWDFMRKALETINQNQALYRTQKRVEECDRQQDRMHVPQQETLKAQQPQEFRPTTPTQPVNNSSQRAG